MATPPPAEQQALAAWYAAQDALETAQAALKQARQAVSTIAARPAPAAVPVPFAALLGDIPHIDETALGFISWPPSGSEIFRESGVSVLTMPFPSSASPGDCWIVSNSGNDPWPIQITPGGPGGVPAPVTVNVPGQAVVVALRLKQSLLLLDVLGSFFTPPAPF
jgi:hypothetical protein